MRKVECCPRYDLAKAYLAVRLVVRPDRVVVPVVADETSSDSAALALLLPEVAVVAFVRVERAGARPLVLGAAKFGFFSRVLLGLARSTGAAAAFFVVLAREVVARLLLTGAAGTSSSLASSSPYPALEEGIAGSAALVARVRVVRAGLAAAGFARVTRARVERLGASSTCSSSSASLLCSSSSSCVSSASAFLAAALPRFAGFSGEAGAGAGATA